MHSKEKQKHRRIELKKSGIVNALQREAEAKEIKTSGNSMQEIRKYN